MKNYGEQLKNGLRKYKRIIAAFIIVFISVVVELAANIQALRGGYDSLDISQNISIIEEGDKEKYRIEFKVKEGVYVQQIQLHGNFPKDVVYRVKTKEVNGFGKKEDGVYKDTVGPYFSEYSTNLGKKITWLRITMEKTEGMELTGITCSSSFEWNKYRMFFVIIVLGLFYCIFFEKKFLKRIEWYFAVFALTFGLLLIALAQPMCNSWDEQIHFKSAYILASGRTIQWTEAAQKIVDRTNFRCNTKAEFAQLRKYMDNKGKVIVREENRKSLLISYQYLAYLPMALFLGIGKLLKLPFSMLFAFGKVGNLVLYVFVMFWAIHLAKSKKLFLAFIAMMPTPLFQASSYTYDAVVFSFLTLVFVLWYREMLRGDGNCDFRMVIAAALLFVFGSFSKAIYIPIVLLLLLLPLFHKITKKQKLFLITGICLIFFAVMLTFTVPLISNILAGNYNYGGDSRGGDTSAVRQMISMLKHPWESVKLLIGNMISLDNFRNLGVPESANYFFGNLMLLSLGSMGTLGDKWCVVLLPVLTLLLLYEEPQEQKDCIHSLWRKIFI